MITPVGGDSMLTASAVKAGINNYTLSDFDNHQDESISMAEIPEDIYEEMSVDVIGGYYSELYERIIKMAIVAIREATKGLPSELTVPLVLAMPESLPDIKTMTVNVLVNNLLNDHGLPIKMDQISSINTGRAAGIQAIKLASKILQDTKQDYVLLGASDSFWHLPIIKDLDESRRLLAAGSTDGFAPGEGSGFLLMTKDPRKAMEKNGHIIAMNPPGLGQERGNIASDGSKPYQGDGLDGAFKKVLESYQGEKINTVYSSMNGEAYWAKEYGVSMTRNKRHFSDEIETHHPAEAYGDLGAATGPVLMGLSAINLLTSKSSNVNLVYSSSDSAHRAAILLEKMSPTHDLAKKQEI